MVCLGNICRSPLAEGILRQKVDKRSLDWTIESAGTAGYHQGQGPDHRSVAIARNNNIDISRQSARQFLQSDLEIFDHILTMDAQNYQDVKRLANGEQSQRIELILNYLYPGENRAVPDPYYGGPSGFEDVYELLDKACEAFIENTLREKL